MTGYAFFVLNTSLKTVMCIYYYRQGRRAYFSPRLLMIAFANSSSVLCALRRFPVDHSLHICRGLRRAV